MLIRAVLIFVLTTGARCEPSRPLTVVGVKLMKGAAEQAQTAFEVHLPADCADCSIVNDAAFEGENPREIYFHLRVPSEKPVVQHVRVNAGGATIRAVIVEKQRIPFTTAKGEIVFDLPVVPRPRSSTVEMQTSLEWPGIVLRIEHAFTERRAGKYAKGEFPAVQRAAALNLEFGLREAVRYMKLDSEVTARGLGKVHLMGFDTNDPLGHEDYPPHIHMILRWPHFAGSQAPHYYINPHGVLLPEVTVTLDGLPDIHPTQFGKGAWVPAVDYLGEKLFETLVTGDGGLTLRRPGGDSCTLEPLEGGDRGFATGSVVHCGAGSDFHVRAADDTESGEVRVRIDARAPETYRYDVDTAVLLSADPPLPGAKVR